MAFDHFIINYETYEADIPFLKEYLIQFISRSIYDFCLNGSYLTMQD